MLHPPIESAAEVGRSTPAAGEPGQFYWQWGQARNQDVGNAMAVMGSVAAGRGQFRWRSWSAAVAKMGRWLALFASTAVSAGNHHC